MSATLRIRAVATSAPVTRPNTKMIVFILMSAHGIRSLLKNETQLTL